MLKIPCWFDSDLKEVTNFNPQYFDHDAVKQTIDLKLLSEGELCTVFHESLAKKLKTEPRSGLVSIELLGPVVATLGTSLWEESGNIIMWEDRSVEAHDAVVHESCKDIFLKMFPNQDWSVAYVGEGYEAIETALGARKVIIAPMFHDLQFVARGLRKTPITLRGVPHFVGVEFENTEIATIRLVMWLGASFVHENFSASLLETLGNKILTMQKYDYDAIKCVKDLAEKNELKFARKSAPMPDVPEEDTLSSDSLSPR